MANFLGQQWTSYPPVTSLKQLSIVQGDRVVYHRILHFLFLEKGEDPLHPEMGIAVPLFYPQSDDRAEFLVYSLKEELIKWNRWAAIGLKTLEVTTDNQRGFSNEINVDIRYSTANGSFAVLTFGLFSYTNARATGNVEPFLDAISINGLRLRDWGVN